MLNWCFASDEFYDQEYAGRSQLGLEDCPGYVTDEAIVKLWIKNSQSQSIQNQFHFTKRHLNHLHLYLRPKILKTLETWVIIAAAVDMK